MICHRHANFKTYLTVYIYKQKATGQKTTKLVFQYNSFLNKVHILSEI